MTLPCVVDSSVAYKWFADEPGSREASELLLAHRDGAVSLIAPTLLSIEVADALRYSGLSESDVLGGLDALARFHLVLVEPDAGSLAQACRLGFRHGLTVYDGLFLGLAIANGCALVSSDRRAFGSVPADVCEIRLL